MGPEKSMGIEKRKGEIRDTSVKKVREKPFLLSIMYYGSEKNQKGIVRKIKVIAEIIREAFSLFAFQDSGKKQLYKLLFHSVN